MSFVSVFIPMETQVKSEAEKIFKKIGVSIEEIVKAVYHETVSAGELPFEVDEAFIEKDEVRRRGLEAIKSMQEESVRNGNSEMTMEEIDAEIEACRRERRERREHEKISA